MLFLREMYGGGVPNGFTVDQNRRKSQLRRFQNRIFAIFASQNAPFRSQITDLFRGFLPYRELVSWVTPIVIDYA